MNIQDNYSEWSKTYDEDRNLTRDLDEQITRDWLGSQHFQTILEVGCGTGKNTARLVQHADQVVALDFSPGMISRAKAKLSDSSVGFAVADLTKMWPCADHSGDLVICNLVLEHIENLNFIFTEARRVLAANGQFFISELHPFKQYKGKKATFARDSGQVEIPAFVHHISDFVTAAQQAGFAVKELREWWHAEDEKLMPRLVSFVFQSSSPA